MRIASGTRIRLALVPLLAVAANGASPAPAPGQGSVSLWGMDVVQHGPGDVRNAIVCGSTNPSSGPLSMSCPSPGPGGGTYAGFASAHAGTIRTMARADVAGASNGMNQRWWLAESSASWRDVAVFGPSAAVPATLQLTLRWDGTLFASAAGQDCAGAAFLSASFMMLERSTYLDIWNSPPNFGARTGAECHTNLQPPLAVGANVAHAGYTRTFHIPIVHGRAEFSYHLGGSHTIYHGATPAPLSASIGSDFGHTVEVIGIVVADAAGTDVTRAVTFAFQHGTTAVSAVPEPATLALVGGGLAVLLGATRRRRG